MREKPKVSKTFDANRGVALDFNFAEHAKECARCAQFDPQKPATATALCLEGAVLWKRDNAQRPKLAQAPADPNRGTKAQVRAAMRYKGE